MIFDIDIIIWYLRGNILAAKMLAATPRRIVSIVTMLELVRGVHDKRELMGLKPELARLDIEVIPLSERIGQRALELMERHSLKDGLETADSIIAWWVTLTLRCHTLWFAATKTTIYGTFLEAVSHSHPPGIIAATALESGQPFATANGKHFKPLGLDLHVFKP